jgi:hypothetical protein
MGMVLAPVSALGDLRRDQRGEQILERMIEQCSAQMRVLSRSRAEEVAFSRFFLNPHFGAQDLRASMGQACLTRCAGRRHVLAIQDTTEINYQRHAERVQGLGPVGNGTDAGLFVHAVLALDAEDRTCLGLLDARPWIRVPRTGDYRRLPVEQKESRRWLDGLATAALAEADLVTCIQDREADMFEMFARRPHERCHLLQRASRNRALTDGSRLFAAMAELPASFGYTIPVPGRRNMPERTACLLVRFGALTLVRPQRSKEPTESVRVFAVDVAELADDAIPARERIHWRLLTTHKVEDAAMAAQIIDWYRQRWHIEQLFRILKSQGLDLEASQSEDAHALSKLAVMAAHAASRITQLVQARDGHNGVAAGEVFEPAEIEVMSALLPQLQGRTEKQKNPHPPDTLAWCAWIVARLGGWKGYRHSEGPPGPLTMQRGYQRFCSLRDGYFLAQKNVCKP